MCGFGKRNDKVVSLAQAIDFATKERFLGQSPIIRSRDASPLLARWTGKINIDSAGTYDFTVHGNDEIALFIDGEPVASGSIGTSNGIGTGSKQLSAGLHYVTVNYARWGGEEAHLKCYGDRSRTHACTHMRIPAHDRLHCTAGE